MQIKEISLNERDEKRMWIKKIRRIIWMEKMREKV